VAEIVAKAFNANLDEIIDKKQEKVFLDFLKPGITQLVVKQLK